MRDIVKIVNDIKKDKMRQKDVDTIIKQGFNDYNNDYSEEIKYILTHILKNPNIIIDNKDISALLNVIIKESDINIFFDNYQNKKLTYTQKEIDMLLDVSDITAKNQKNKDKFFEEILSQENVELTELFKLKLLVKNKKVALKLLEKENISLSQPLIDFLNNHYFYADIVKGKLFKVINDNSVQKLSQELLKSQNYMNDFMTQQPKADYDESYINNFFDKTYSMIFDETNNNRNEFSFDIVKKKIKTAIEITEYNKNYKPMSIEEFKEKNKGKVSIFSKIK